MRVSTHAVYCLAAAVAVRAAADPFYRVGVVVEAERRQFSSNTDLGTMSGTDIGIPTASSTSSSATPTPTPVLTFHGSPALSTCDTAIFEWSYSGPTDTYMSLLVTNVNVPQEPAPSSDEPIHSTIFTRREELTTMISSFKGQTQYTGFLSVTLNPYSKAYTWSPINLPEGWYRLESNISSSHYESLPFYVNEGIDTSCVLPPAPSGSSSSSETPTPTSEPGQTGSPTPVPMGKAANVGAIAGGVVGGVIGLALILLLLLFLRRRSRRSNLESAGSPPKSRFLGAWGNLGSFESKSSRTPGDGAGNTRPDHTRGDSMGAPMILSQASSPAATRLGHGDGSDENMPYQEKGFADRSMSMESQSPFSDIPIAVYDGSGGSRPTRNSSMSSKYNFAMGRRSTSQTFPESVHNSIASSYPSGFGGYTIPPSPTMVNTSSTAFFPSPSPVPPETTPPHPRKTPRKPVPSYNPDDPTMAGAEYSRSSIPSDSDDRDSDDAPTRQPIRHNDSSSSLHSNTKQLHVLIPDMPLPQRG